MVDVDLAGSSLGLATVSGASALERALAGSSLGLATVSGASALERALAGSSAGVALVQGDVKVRVESFLTLELLAASATSPGQLPVSVGNGDPFGTAYFFMDGAASHFQSQSLDTTGAARPVYLSISRLAVGTHVLRVSPDPSPPPAYAGSVSFTVTQSKDTFVVVPVTGQAPPMPNQVDRWVFQAYDFADINAVDTWLLPLNPDRMSRSFGGTPITDEPTTVSNGRMVSWEGAPKPPVWSWEGRVLTEDAVRQIVRWAQTAQRFYVTDHFGHRYLVKVTDFDIQRVRDIQRPWHHSYRMTVNVLRGTGVLA